MVGKRIAYGVGRGGGAPRMQDARPRAQQQAIGSDQFEQEVLRVIARRLGGTLKYENGEISDTAKGVLSQTAGSPKATVLNTDESLVEIDGKLHAQPTTRDIISKELGGVLTLHEVIVGVGLRQGQIEFDIARANRKNKQLLRSSKIESQRVISGSTPFGPGARR